MKRISQIAIIALFIGALWIPLLYTPLRFEQERRILRYAEQRTPSGTLSFSECDRNVERWVEEVQEWYRDSFAFRSRLLNLFNATHYLLRNYPDEVFGVGGHLLQRKGIVEGLVPLTGPQREQIKENLTGLQTICEEAGIPCVFIIIPSKLTVYPQLAPRWVQSRNLGQLRNELIGMIRAAEFPVFDLSDGVKAYAEETGLDLFLKYDPHWNMAGAVEGYREIMGILSEYCSEARTVPEALYEVSEKEAVTRFTQRRYLDFMLSEPESTISKIDLPPVRVVSADGTESAVLRGVSRAGVTEVFCPELGSQTVVFMRDSFLSSPSLLLNHSLPHSVYMNFSEEGEEPRKAIERYRPDLLVFALQESRVKRALLRLRSSDGN